MKSETRGIVLAIFAPISAALFGYALRGSLDEQRVAAFEQAVADAEEKAGAEARVRQTLDSLLGQCEAQSAANARSASRWKGAFQRLDPSK